MFTLLLLVSSLHAGDGVPAVGVPHPLPETDGLLDPTWSDDGRLLTATGPRYRGLLVLDPAGNSPPSPLFGDGASFWRHAWSGTPGDPVRVLERSLEPGYTLSPPTGQRTLSPPPVAFTDGDDVFLRTPDGVRRLTTGEDRFFEPVPSPDGTLLAFVGLATGVHLLDPATGRIVHGGPGTHPSWTPDGSWLLFERVTDDGHDVTDGDLWALHQEGRLVRLTRGPAIDRHPAVSPDGTRVAFLRDGRVVVADLQEVAP